MFRINPIPSKVKAEKVVNPPHKPVIRNNFQCSLLSKLLKVMPHIIPIIKQPVMFTAKVPREKNVNRFQQTIVVSGIGKYYPDHRLSQPTVYYLSFDCVVEHRFFYACIGIMLIQVFKINQPVVISFLNF